MDKLLGNTVEFLPSRKDRLLSGILERRVMTSKGERWQTRRAVLTETHLLFSRMGKLPDNGGQTAELFRCLGHMERVDSEFWLHTDQVYEVFKNHDFDGNGELDVHELAAALKEMGLEWTQSRVEEFLAALDKDDSKSLSWEEFKKLHTHALASNTVVDEIPLEEVECVEYEIGSKAHSVERTNTSKFVRNMRTNTEAAEYHRQSSNITSKSTVMEDEVSGSQVSQHQHEGYYKENIKGLLYKFERLIGLEDNGLLTNVHLPEFNPSQEHVLMVLLTRPGGHNSGRSYVHILPAGREQEWLTTISNAVHMAKRREHERMFDEQFGDKKFERYRAEAKILYTSRHLQAFIGCLILISFSCEVIDAQVLPATNSALHKTLFGIDIIISLFFLGEMLLNIFAHINNIKEYLTILNGIDAVIVVVSFVNIMLTAFSARIPEPNLKLVRIARLGRIVRLFSTLKDLQKLVSSLTAALYPVMNAFFILIIITCIYAIVGTHAYRVRSPEYFGNFAASLFTMFQVLTGDSWSSAVARSLFSEEGKTETIVALFFISYILIAGVMMMNVVIAVLLDEFIASVTKAKEEQARIIWQEKEKRKTKGCLDPLTLGLITFEDEEDLLYRIDNIYQALDVDDSGGLNFEEFRAGVKELSSNVHLTRDDFDIITENGKHLNPKGEFNRIQFQEMMKGELWRYSRRLLSNELLVSDDEHFRSTILMLKLMENHISMSEDREEWLLNKIYAAVGRPDETYERSGGTGQKAEIGNSFSPSTPVDDVKDLILELTKQVSNQALELRSIKELLQNSSVIDAANAKAKTKDSEQVLPEANATIQNSEHHLQGIRRADMPLHVTSTFPSFDGIVHSTVVDAAEAKAMTQDQLSIGDRESPEISVETGTESKTRARSGKLTAFRNDIYLQYESYASFKPALH